jgi:hypothetical protein
MLSIYNTLTGTEAAVLKAGSTIGGLTFDSANRFVTVAAATTTLTLTQALHAGKIVLVQSTGGLAITPPAATGTGDIYQVYVMTTISGGNLTIDPKAGNASDVCGGVSIGGSSGGTAGTFGSAANSNLMTFNGSTQGGLIGTQILMTDVKTNAWAVRIYNVCSGTAATPFSNH